MNDNPKPSTEVVPFGKYKGQPVEVLFADQGYRDWLLAQPWVKDRFGSFHQVIINYGAEPQDTPEHNQMQASFLDDERCNRLAQLLWPGRVWETRKAVTADRRLVELLRRYPEHVTVDWHEWELVRRRFEVDGWDVVWGYESPAAEPGMLRDNPIPCTCMCDHSECESGAPCRPDTPPPVGWHPFEPQPITPPRRVVGGWVQTPERDYNCGFCIQPRYHAAHQDPRCGHARHEDYRLDELHRWTDANIDRLGFFPGHHCSEECPYASDWLCTWLNDSIHGHWYSPEWKGLVRVELKPDLGDDFPTVLRQVLRYPREPSDRVCVVVRRHRFQAVTWQQVFDMFAASKIRLIQESELNPVRAIEAADP